MGNIGDDTLKKEKKKERKKERKRKERNIVA